MNHPVTLLAFLLLALPCSLHARNQIVTEHYVVVFENGNEFFANEVVDVAEEIWSSLATAYDIFDRYQKIYLYILDPGDYANGFAIANKNTVTVYTTNLNAGIRGTSNWIRNVVTHELAHVFSLKAASKSMLFDNVSLQSWSRFRNPDWAVQARYWNLLAPMWWIEGIAQYEAYRNRNDLWDSHRDMFLRMATLENDLLDYVEMGTFGNRNGFYEEMVYNQGYSMVLYMDSVFGTHRVHETAKAKSYFNFNGTLEKVTGRSGETIYRGWKKTLREKYGTTAAAITPRLHEGTPFFDGGFWDQFPVISPDNGSCAFVSNKGYDVRYPHLFIFDKRLKTSTRLLKEDQTVDSRVQWFPDGNTLLYSRWNSRAAYLDIYKYDVARRTEKAITWHARAMDPALSGDGKTIAYIENNGGMQNLVLIDADGRNRRQLTNFANGTQLFSPCWSPDNHSIVLGIYNGADRDIAQVCALAAPLDKKRKLTDTVFFPESLSFGDDLEFRLLVHSTADERDPCLSRDGKTLYYSSDRTGVFNIYMMNLATGKTEQVTNVLGGAFHPSVDRDNAFLYYTGFHAADYSIYTVAVEGVQEVVVENVGREYAKRIRRPYLFSAGADDGTGRLKPYQYPLSPYKPAYTMWDISPFLNFSPAYITDSIGDAQIRGGMQFLFGELSGRASLLGYAYGGKSPKSKAGLSWGGGMLADIRLPRIMGQDRIYLPSLTTFGGLDEIRDVEQLRPQAIDAQREPYQSLLYLPGETGRPDTFVAQYVDYADGSFSSAQRFEDIGISGGLRFNEWNRLDADISRRSVSFSGSLLDATIRSEIRAFALANPFEARGARDITNQVLNDSRPSTWLDDVIREYSVTLDPLTFLDEYKDFLVYRDFRTGLTWSYTNIRPAQVLPLRADLFSARAGLSGSTYSLGAVGTGSDTLFSPHGATTPQFIFSKRPDGTPTAFMVPLLQQENFSSIELSALERFPLWGSKRHVATATAFFGTLDRKLPELGSVYPLQYRAGMFLSAYPYSFDPIDTATVVDSFFVPVVRGMSADTGFVTTRRMVDAIERDILWGNRIMYLNASYTFELARGITFKPLGLLLQGVYATAFAEGAALWNSDLGVFSFQEILGIDRPDDFSRIGKSYLKDAGLRLDLPFVLFENWNAFFSFTWACRLSLDDKIYGIDYDRQGRPSRIRRLDKNRYSFTLVFTN
ncbi:MAG: PD40 domain-containing protein [Chitinispirillaceae bacterium]|nr:PD40 domain-containing protein [Chitinispirillaceae bacterium]